MHLHPSSYPDPAYPPPHKGRGASHSPGPASRGCSGNLRRGDRELRQARTLDDNQIDRVLAYIQAFSNSPASDELKFLFSVYAGLRVAEIAGMTLDAVVDADDRIAHHIRVGRHIAKGGRGRIVPMHPRIREALLRFRRVHPDVRFLCFSARRAIRRQNVNAVKCWFSSLYAEVGLHGCSSHSGRRTFITRMARMANLHGKSLRDVQLLAGHARLDTTAGYIDPADDLSGLVAAMSGGRPRLPSTPNRKEPQHETN